MTGSDRPLASTHAIAPWSVHSPSPTSISTRPAAARLAHRSLAVTALYAHGTDEARRAAANRVQIGVRSDPLVAALPPNLPPRLIRAAKRKSESSGNPATSAMPKDGIEPPTRGFSSLGHKLRKQRINKWLAILHAQPVTTLVPKAVAAPGSTLGHQLRNQRIDKWRAILHAQPVTSALPTVVAATKKPPSGEDLARLRACAAHTRELRRAASAEVDGARRVGRSRGGTFRP